MATKQTTYLNVTDSVVCKETDKVPKLLPCRHSVCETCIDSLTWTTPTTVACPVCRQEVILPPGGAAELPTSVPAIQLQDFAKNQMMTLCEYCQV